LTSVDIAQISAHTGTNAAIQNRTSMELKKNQTPSSTILMNREKGRKANVVMGQELDSES
jgi:hypothetical protein